MNDRPYENKLNALLGGELSAEELQALEQASLSDPELAADLHDALQLQQLLVGMPRRQAPGRLRRKLARVPDAETAAPRWLGWPRLGFLTGGVVAVLLLTLVESGGPTQPSIHDIEQGRRELALALAYLGEAGGRVSATLDNRIDSAVIEPVTDHTSALMSRTPVLNEEMKL